MLVFCRTHPTEYFLMDFRIGYRRPLRTVSVQRKKRLRIKLALGAALVAASALIALRGEPVAPVAHMPGSAAPVAHFAYGAPAAANTARRIYPYSIVPGGVASREDLARRAGADPVVARHYASFDIGKAHPVAVTRARAVHVSYRKGDKVYWTAHKVMLAAGETVFTDGASDIRGRCGNRISDRPQLPVAMNEPSAQELDASMSVAFNGDDDGGLQNTGFSLDDDLPAGSATRFQHLAGVAAPDAAPASALTRTAMPAMPTVWNGGSGGMGMQPTRFLTVSSGPTVALGPTTEVATTVVPGASTGTPATAMPVPAATGTPSTPSGAAPADTAATPTVPTVPAVSTIPTVPAVPSLPAGTPATAGPAAPPPVAPGKPALPEGEIPEPATLWLSGAALAGMLLVRRSKASRRDAGPHSG